jgi:exopolysaccharide production protein ExoQ
MTTTSIGRQSAPAAMPPAQAAARPTLFNLGLPILTLADMAFVVVWSIISVFPIPGAGPLRYLCAAYVMGCLFIYPRQLLPSLVRGALIFAIPVLAIISSTWAPSSSDAIRKGVLMALTGLFAIYFANRMTARQFLFAYVVFELGAGLLSLIHLNMFMGTAGGIFGQKNYLAIHMFILYMAGMTLALDRQTNKLVRMIAAVGLPVALILIILSRSTTTIALAAVATLAMLVHAFLWDAVKRVKHMRSIIAILAALLVIILAIVVFGLMQVDLGETLLKVAGKDSTLTGRTYLWDIARRIMTEHPLTGVGANGFWRPENGAANSITTFFFYEHFVTFSFHNSYLEIGVQLGYPGMYIAILLSTWALSMAAITWFRNQTLINFFFLVMSTMIVIRTNTEADLITDFSATVILLYIGAIRRAPPPPRPVVTSPLDLPPMAPMMSPYPPQRRRRP